MAGTASLRDFITGKSKATGLSLRGGASLSMQSLSACMSPAFASSMAFRVRASPSPSSNASIAKVALLRDPAALPFGLPDWPFFHLLSCGSSIAVTR